MTLDPFTSQVPSDKAVPFLWTFMKPRWLGLLTLMLTGFFWSVNEGLFPYFIKEIVNGIHSHQGDLHGIWRSVKVPFLELVCVWFTFELVMRLQGFLMFRIFPDCRADIRKSVFSYVRRQSPSYFHNNFSGSIANKIGDLARSSENILELILLYFPQTFFYIVLSSILLWQASPIFFLIMISWLTLHTGISVMFAKSCNSLSRMHANALSVLSGKIVDSLSNVHPMHLMLHDKYENESLGTYQETEIKHSRHASWHIELMKLAQGFVSFLYILAVTGVLIIGWSQGWVTIGDFTLIAMLSFGLFSVVSWMGYQVTKLYKDIGAVQSSLELVSQGGNFQCIESDFIEMTEGTIVFDKISFGYEPGKTFLKDLSVVIPGGQKVGLVGFSGSGKSTFVNLIMHFYDVESGKITIDGQDVALVSQYALRKNIALIPQDTTLFHRTLMENIRYGRQEATDEEVIEAAKKASCHEFIMELNEGYDTLVGGSGIRLSGGQKQRLSIARAILADAFILILDEATSALDSVTERSIQHALHHSMQNRTSIVIAHRLSTLQDLDRILVFDEGKIVEDGTHAALLAKKGHYAQLWEMQVGGFLPKRGVRKSTKRPKQKVEKTQKSSVDF